MTSVLDTGSSAVDQASTDLARRWSERDREPDLIDYCHSMIALRDVDSAKASILFLHGFNSAPGELFDQVLRLATATGSHLLAPRLPGHGSSNPAAMRGVTAEDWVEAVQAAYEDARSLADEVIVVGSSLGGSLALELASRRRVAALVLWSPGVRAVDDSLLSQFCAAGDDVLLDTRDRTPGQEQWNRRAIHADGFRALRDMFERYMVPALFARVTAPTWMGYYFRDQANQDLSSRVDAMLAMWEQLGTSKAAKHARAFSNGAHNLASPERSADSDTVLGETAAFLRTVIGP